MTLRPRIRANSKSPARKNHGAHLHLAPFRPILSDSSRGPAGSHNKKQTQESLLLQLRSKRIDDLSSGSPRRVHATPLSCRPSMPTTPKSTHTVGRQSLGFNCACINGTKTSCAVLPKAAVYRHCVAKKPVPCTKLSRITTAGLFVVSSRAQLPRRL